MPVEKPMCRTCRQQPARTRGACRRCYLAHKLSVHRGDTTWRALEAAGLTLPDGRGLRHQKRRHRGKGT